MENVLCKSVSFPSVTLFWFGSIGRPKHIRVMAGALEGDLFVGPKAEEHRGLLSIRYPMEHGIVTDWNDMERIWQYIYSKDQLQTFSEEVIRVSDFYYCASKDDNVFCLTQQKICSWDYYHWHYWTLGYSLHLHCHNTVGGLTVTLNCCESLKSINMGRSIGKKEVWEKHQVKLSELHFVQAFCSRHL